MVSIRSCLRQNGEVLQIDLETFWKLCGTFKCEVNCCDRSFYLLNMEDNFPLQIVASLSWEFLGSMLHPTGYL